MFWQFLTTSKLTLADFNREIMVILPLTYDVILLPLSEYSCLLHCWDWISLDMKPNVMCRRAHSQSWAARVMWEHWSALCLSLRGDYLHVDPPRWAPRLFFFRPPEYGPDPDCLLPSLTWPSLAGAWKTELTDAHLPVCTLEVHGACI